MPQTVLEQRRPLVAARRFRAPASGPTNWWYLFEDEWWGHSFRWRADERFGGYGQWLRIIAILAIVECLTTENQGWNFFAANGCHSNLDMRLESASRQKYLLKGGRYKNLFIYISVLFDDILWDFTASILWQMQLSYEINLKLLQPSVS